MIDEDRGWWCARGVDRMRDPGDGSVHQEYNFTLLKYAGEGKWSYEEDIYNPMRFGAMVAAWEEAEGRPPATVDHDHRFRRRHFRRAFLFTTVTVWRSVDWEEPVTIRRWPCSEGPAFRDPEFRHHRFRLRRGLGRGVNHLDIAPQYGRAEVALGPLIPAVRDRLFVACKTLRHDRDGVRAQLEESLQVLGCDYFDLYQLHAVTDLDELEARAGAIEAILAAWMRDCADGSASPATI